MPLSMMTRRLSVAVSVVPISVLLIYVGAATASAATTPPTPTATAIRPDPTLPIVFLVASIIAIAAALYFALRYHKLLIGFMGRALRYGKTYDAESTQAIANRSIAPVPAQATAPKIIGSDSGTPGQEMLFLIMPPISAQYDDAGQKKAVEVMWSVDGKPVKGFTGDFLKRTFRKSGEFVLEATAGELSTPLVKVSIVAPAGGNASLPFAIENWGRLVTVLFGLGVVGALMAIGALSSDAGAGLLGAMLGIGAASVASGGGKEKTASGGDPTPTPDDNPKPDSSQ